MTSVLRSRLRPAALLLCALMAGCSAEQFYLSGQQWQRSECRKLPAAEQQRCLASTAMSFDEYQRQAAAARANPPAGKVVP